MGRSSVGNGFKNNAGNAGFAEINDRLLLPSISRNQRRIDAAQPKRHRLILSGDSRSAKSDSVSALRSVRHVHAKTDAQVSRAFGAIKHDL